MTDVQRALIATFDEARSPEAVCDRLGRALDRLRAGEVDPVALARPGGVGRRGGVLRRRRTHPGGRDVLSPVGWRERRIRRYLADRTNASLRRYADTVPE
ncbi:hypothetical protein [Halorussus marinus]|uniref:hypothetical protein n=1 Tax=Halorussus marinus TaxID=2505976 RepID=UPI00106EFF6A|nr:hypothetical protein [Halorussus marinus]